MAKKKKKPSVSQFTGNMSKARTGMKQVKQTPGGPKKAKPLKRNFNRMASQ